MDFQDDCCVVIMLLDVVNSIVVSNNI